MNQIPCCCCARTISILRVHAGHQDGRNHGQSHRDLVRHHLRARTQRPNQWVVRVRRPSRHHHSQHAQRRNSQHEQDSDVHVADRLRGSEWNDGVNRKRGQQPNEWSDPEDEFVSLCRDDVFLQQQLERIGKRLQQSVRPDSHWPDANLEVGQGLTLDPVHGNHCDRDAREDQENVNQRPQLVVGFAWSDVASDVGHERVEHQRSTSPSTISSVPITATTSATSMPRTMTSSA
jgi:hypothetical protein